MNATIEISAQRGQAFGKLEFSPKRELATPLHILVVKAFDRLIIDLNDLLKQSDEALQPVTESDAKKEKKEPEVKKEDKNEPPKGVTSGNTQAKEKLGASTKDNESVVKNTPSAGVFPPAQGGTQDPLSQPVKV